MSDRFAGKTGLVLGVANRRSIAWGIAQQLADGGAQLAFTYQGDRIEKNVRELAETVGSTLITSCDVRSDEDLERVFAEVGEAFGATLSVMLVGERPGLSSPDSLGIYLTHTPRRGRHDAERNCISNVRPEGLGHEAAAFKLAWLMRAALRGGATGIALKDESDLAVLESGKRDSGVVVRASSAPAPRA